MKQDFETCLLTSQTTEPVMSVSSDLLSKCVERSSSYVPSYETTGTETYDVKPTKQCYFVRISPCQSEEEDKYIYEQFNQEQKQTNYQNSQKNELSDNKGIRITSSMKTLNKKRKENRRKVATMKDIRLICRRYMERNLKHGVHRSVTKKDVQLIRKRFEEEKGKNGGRTKGRYVTSISLPKRKRARKGKLKDEEHQNDLSFKSNTNARDLANDVILGEQCIVKTENNIGEERCLTGDEDYLTNNEKPSALEGNQFAEGVKNHCMDDKHCFKADEEFFTTDENCFKENENQPTSGENCLTREEFISKIDEYFAEKENILRREANFPFEDYGNRFHAEDSTEKEVSNNIASEYYPTTASNRNIESEYMNSHEEGYMSSSGLSHEEDRMDMTTKENSFQEYFPKGYIVTTGLYKQKEIEDYSDEEHEKRTMSESDCENSYKKWKNPRKESEHDIVQVYEKERKEGGYFERKRSGGERDEEDDKEEGYEKEGWGGGSEASFEQNCEQRDRHYAFEQEESECGSVNSFHQNNVRKDGNRSHCDQGYEYKDDNHFEQVYNCEETGESESEYFFDDVYDDSEARPYKTEDLFQQIQAGETDYEDSELGYGYKDESEYEYDSTLEQCCGQSECEYPFEEEYEVKAESESDAETIVDENSCNEGIESGSEYFSELEYKRDMINDSECESTFDNSYPEKIPSGNEYEKFLGGYSVRRYSSDTSETKRSSEDFNENRGANSANIPSFRGEELYDNYKGDNSVYNTSCIQTMLANNTKEGYSITLPSISTTPKRTHPKLNFM